MLDRVTVVGARGNVQPSPSGGGGGAARRVRRLARREAGGSPVPGRAVSFSARAVPMPVLGVLGKERGPAGQAWSRAGELCDSLPGAHGLRPRGALCPIAGTALSRAERLWSPSLLHPLGAPLSHLLGLWISEPPPGSAPRICCTFMFVSRHRIAPLSTCPREALHQRSGGDSVSPFHEAPRTRPTLAHAPH